MIFRRCNSSEGRCGRTTTNSCGWRLRLETCPKESSGVDVRLADEDGNSAALCITLCSNQMQDNTYSNNFFLNGFRHRFTHGMDVKLLIDVADVKIHGMITDVELIGDHFIAHAID